MALVPCLHQSNIYIRRVLGVSRYQISFPLFGAKTPVPCAVRQSIPFQERRYRAENGNLYKLGRIYCIGTVFEPIKYLYQKTARGRERPDMYCFSRCKNPLTCAGRQSIPSQGRRYTAENGNLRKLGRIYRLDTEFAPRQY